MRADAEVVEAIARIAALPDGRRLTQMLEAELEATRDALVDAAPDLVPKLQGRARTLKELVALLKHKQVTL